MALYGYSVDSRKYWKGDDCFEASTSSESYDIGVLGQLEPKQRTVCGLQITSLQDPHSFEFEGEMMWFGSISLPCP